jgi:hypothetical protein
MNKSNEDLEFNNLEQIKSLNFYVHIGYVTNEKNLEIYKSNY